MTGFLWIISLAGIIVLACKRASIAVASIGIGLLLALISCLSNLSVAVLTTAWILLLLLW